MLRASALLITLMLAPASFAAEAVNPPRPAPVAVGQIGISIVVPPREEPADSKPEESEQASEEQ